jgi:hypothetical protein
MKAMPSPHLGVSQPLGYVIHHENPSATPQTYSMITRPTMARRPIASKMQDITTPAVPLDLVLEKEKIDI